MFYRLGIKQLLKNKRVMALSILAIGLGVGILYTINISADTIQNAIEVRSNYLFSNVDYTVYRSGVQYYDNTSCGIPYTYINNVRSVPGVEHVVARATAWAAYYGTDDTTMFGNDAAGIDVDNPDETVIGVANLTSYDPAIGTGITTIEEVLNYTGVVRPIVISDRMSISKGISIGDKIRILPSNATKRYATPQELADVAANITTAAELEQNIRKNASRIEQFTVVGIVIDGSEGAQKPIAKDAQSLNGFVPGDECIYARLNDTLYNIHNRNYNNVTKEGEVGFFMVGVSKPFPDGVSAFSNTTTAATGSVTIVANDIRAHFQGYIDYASFMMRTVLIILTTAAFISCFVLIKTVIQMNLTEKMHELGVLRSLGFKKKALNEIVIGQVTVMTAIGVGAGLLIGMAPPYFFDVSAITQFLSYNKQFAVADITVTISLVSTVISIAAGIILPFLSSSVPLYMARKWSVVEMISPLYMQMKETTEEYKKYPASIKHKAWNRLLKQHGLIEASWLWRNKQHVAAALVQQEIATWKGIQMEKEMRRSSKKKTRKMSRQSMKPKVALAWTAILIVSFFSFYFGAINIFTEKGSFKLDFEAAWPWMLATVGGIFFLLVAIWQLSADQIGGVSSLFARLQRRWLGSISHYIPSSIHANTRNIKNLIGFLTLGVTLVGSLVILSDTIQLGNTATNRTYLGGDIAVYSPFIPRSSLPSIRGIDGITGATTYTGVVMDSWKYNFDTAYSYVVNMVDGYGGKHNNITENLNVVVIEPEEYITMNPSGTFLHNEFSSFVPSVYEIDKPNALEDPAAFIRRLESPMTVIVGTPLLDTLGKDIDDYITVSINGFIGSLRIVGAASNLPAAPYMRLMDNPDSKYMTRSMMISRETLSTILDQFVGNVDIMVKNMTLPQTLLNKNYSADAAGYTSGLINMGAVNSTIAAIPGVDKIAYRFSTFAPGAPSLNMTYNPSQLVWKHQNVTINEGDEFPLPLRMFVVNGKTDKWVTGSQQNVVAKNAWWNVFRPLDSKASDVLSSIDTYLELNPLSQNRANITGNAACVTNRFVAAYEDVDNETYVYEMKPGNEIKFSYEMSNGTISSYNFTVVATLDNQISYWWNNGSMREGFKLSSKSLNYNFKANESNDLQDLFDLDGNVLITTQRELGYMIEQMFGVPSFIGIPELGGIPADEIANHIQIKVQSGFNVTAVANSIRFALNAMPGGNYSVIAYKQSFIDKIANTGSLAVSIDPSISEDTALARLEQWFTSNGYTWNVAHVGTLLRQNLGSDIGVAGPILQILFVVSIFSLLISAVGLCTILYANARRRHREFGIYKALGYTKYAIRRMIFFETFLVTSIGIIAGTIAAIAVMGVLYQAIRSSILIPMFFSIPVWTMSITVASLIVIAAITSEAIARHFSKLSTVEIIRYRE